MAKVDTTVGELVMKIRSGELRLPAMQRRYVWPATRVRDLMDSLYRNYPSGTILAWETDTEAPTRDFAVGQGTERAHRLLLDGQQRLTSLSAILRGEPISVRGKRRPIEILFNLDHPEGPPVELLEIQSDEKPEPSGGDSEEPDDSEENVDDDESELDDEPSIQERLQNRTFVVGSKTLASNPRWLKVSDIFRTENDLALLKPLVTSFDDPKLAVYMDRLRRVRRIRDYPYVMHVLDKNLSYEEVAEIFVRVNSLGVKLRGSDLALAQITSRWPESLELFEAFQEECEKTWFTLDLGLIVRALVVFATGQSRFKTVSTTPLETYKSAWEECKTGVLYAINFLRANMGIEDESLLSSPLFIIALAFYGSKRRYRLTNDEERELRRWLHVANAKGLYSGSSETMLDADLAVMKKGQGPAELLDVVKKKFGRLEIMPNDLVGKSSRSAMFSLAFLALKAAGAKDWRTRLGLSLTHLGRYHFIQFHHVFAKALLKQAKYERGAINDLANLAFIAGGTNRKLGAKPPSEYFAAIVKEQGEGALKSHCIPLNPGLWEIDSYPQFLDERRRLLAQVMNDFVHSKESDSEVLSVDALIEQGESATLEFKSTFLWDVNQNKANNDRRLDVLKAIAGFMNSEGGTVLIGVQDSGEIFGLEKDLSTLGKKQDRDNYQLVLVNELTSKLDKDVCSYLSISFHPIGGKEVCRIAASRAPKPVYVEVDGKGPQFYLRAGNSTRPLNSKEANAYATIRWPKK